MPTMRSVQVSRPGGSARSTCSAINRDAVGQCLEASRQINRFRAKRAAVGALSLGAQAVGACALAAVAIGALAIRRLAIGRMAVGHAAIRSLQIDELSVKWLRLERQEHDEIVSVPSRHSVEETITRLKAMLLDKGITLFALIDHSGEATKAGMQMPPTKLLIFGNPKAGTPVMLAAPSSAIDLPLKLLVREDAEGMTWISYNDPKYLQERHRLPAELVQSLAVTAVLAEQAAQ